MKKKWWRILAFVLVVCVLYAGFNVYSMFSFLNQVSTQKPFSVGDTPLTTQKWEGTEQVNILFMGVDRRDPNERPRSDTMLLVSINPNTKKMAVFSIMRDSYVNIPGFGKSKINASFAEGGPELLIKTIQQYLDIPIHYYVATDFEGFAKIIDAIGGVDINVPEDFVHADDGIYDINLKKGMQHLDGHKALMYVRYRSTARADFDRTEHQRELLKLVANKLKSPSMILKMPTILKEITPYTQSNLGADDVYKLASLGLSVDTEGMKTEQLPPVSALQETTLSDGEAVLVPDIEGTRKFLKDTIASEDATPAQSDNGKQQPGTPATNGNSNATSPLQQPAQQAQPQAGNGKSAKVNGEYVNVRQKPGTDYPVIGQVYGGDTVSIMGQEGDWYYVQTKDGMYGYILSNLLTAQ